MFEVLVGSAFPHLVVAWGVPVEMWGEAENLFVELGLASVFNLRSLKRWKNILLLIQKDTIHTVTYPTSFSIAFIFVSYLEPKILFLK